MRKLILAALLVATPTAAHAATEQDADRWEFAYLALSAIDTFQTADCISRNVCHEANPILGGKNASAKQVVFRKLLGTALQFAVFRVVRDKDPKLAMRFAQVGVIVEGAAVSLNARFTF